MKLRVDNSVINKTPLSARTNRIIGGRAPSDYRSRLQNSAEIPADRMDEILRSHVIDPALLRGDRFDEFMAARQNALLDRIEAAMGKAIALRPVLGGQGDRVFCL